MSTTAAPIPGSHDSDCPPTRRGDTGEGARIGPNAIIQTATALRARHGDAVANELLSASTRWNLAHMPAEMVDEGEVNALVRAVLDRYSGGEGRAILRESGAGTASYLLRHRIPAFAQVVLRRLPRVLAIRLLMRAIARHSWTFAGSARFGVARLTSQGGAFTLTSCPICRGLSRHDPVCDYYAGTFESLLRSIVSRNAAVREVECEAAGGACCRFVIQL